MKQTIVSLVLLILVGSIIFSFCVDEKKDRFVEDYTNFQHSLDDYILSKDGGDSVTAYSNLIGANRGLSVWESRIAEAQANRWPGFPANAWCILNCVERRRHCLMVAECDIFAADGMYMDCVENCKRSTFEPNH